MTIAAGFLSPQGIVVVSDSEEGTSKGPKGAVQKVFHEPIPEGQIFFAAAGDADPCDYILSEILEGLRAEKKWDLKRNIGIVRKKVRTYFSEYVWPSGQTYSQVGFVLGFYGGPNEVALLRNYTDATVPRLADYACVGVGAKAAERAAKLMLGKSNANGCRVASFDQLMAIAAYCVWTAKETVEGCGGPTQFAALDRKEGTTTLVADKLLEGAFEEIEVTESVIRARLINHEVKLELAFDDYARRMGHAPNLTGWRRIQHEIKAHKDDFKKQGFKKD